MSDKEHDPSKWDAFDQLRRVWRKWDLRAGIDLSFSLNVLSLRSCQRHHIMRHHPALTKNDQHHRPQLPGYRAMHKQVINRLTTWFTHAAPIQNGHPSFFEILRSENFSQSSCPNKKSPRHLPTIFSLTIRNNWILISISIVNNKHRRDEGKI